jgi:hypothetical protein
MRPPALSPRPRPPAVRLTPSTSGVSTLGFKHDRNTGVVLTVDENVRADVLLEVGQVTNSVISLLRDGRFPST